MAKQTVLVLTTTFPRWKNDTTPGFVHELSARLSQKHHVIALAPHYKGALAFEKMDGVEVRRFTYFLPQSLQKVAYEGGVIPNLKKSLLAKMQFPLLLWREYASARKIVKRNRISLIHAHWVLPQGFIGAMLKKKLNVPLITTIHGSDLFPLKSDLFKKLQYFSLSHADIITVNSEATKRELLSRFPNLNKKVRLIPMGVDTSHFRPRDIKKPLTLKENKIILFVGRLSDQKGLQYLIQAMPSILKRDPKAKLLVIGDGPYKQDLEQCIFSTGVGNAVQLLGALTQEEIAYYHNICDVFVLPALSNETGTEALGLSLLEAMSSGCAVVGTKVGGIPTIIEDKKNGILVDEKNPEQLSKAIVGILPNKKKSSSLGKNASQFVKKNYSWELVVRHFLKAYDEAAR
jgi:L-malate glycosyltransferase